MSYQAFDAEWANERDVEVRDEAESLADRLVPEAAVAGGHLHTVSEPRLLRYERSDYELADAEMVVEGFERQRRVLTQLDLDFPCLHIAHTTPLPFVLAAGDANDDASVTKERLTARIDGLRDQGAEVVLHSTPEARGFLRSRLAAFLAPRVAEARDPDPVPPQGFPFRVETPGRDGLRIHYSPSAALEPGNVFGDTLSTPVVSVITRAGRYFFGIEQAGEVKWDLLAEYRIPGPPDTAIIQ